MRRFVCCVTISAWAMSSCGDPVTSTGNPGPRFFEIVSGDGQTAPVGTQFLAPLVVRVLGGDTLPLRDSRVSFRVAAGSARIDSQSRSTDIGGLAKAYVTPLQPGTIQLSASVYSSAFATTFLLAGSGVSTAPQCQVVAPMTLVVAQVATNLGDGGACVAAGPVNATYALIAFNSPSVDSASPDATIQVAATAIAPALVFRDTLQPQTAPRQAIATSTALFFGQPNAVDSPGNLKQFNVNFTDSCASPALHMGRVAVVSDKATLVVDEASAAVLTDAQLRTVAQQFDAFVDPAVTSNFREPSDIDGNDRVILFFTAAVNQMGPDVQRRNAVFTQRDLRPRTPSAASIPACSGSNEAELLYVAVPDPGGVLGSARTAQELLAAIPRALAHEYQHLVNASRRMYFIKAPLEERWLDEGLSQIAEELLFHRRAARQSRQNLNAYDLALTGETLEAFRDVQRPNLDFYREFLATSMRPSPLGPTDSPATRGAIWSLLRYLVDRHGQDDFISWTNLANTELTGMRNLERVFGGNVRTQMRDWSVSLLIDDLFSSGFEFQQPSWNFRSVFAAIAQQPYPLPMISLTSSGAIQVTIPTATGAYMTFGVPANVTATIAWSGVGKATISPYVQWALVRLQ